MMVSSKSVFAVILLLLIFRESVGFDAKIGLLMRISASDGSFISTFWSRVAACSVMAIRHMNDRNGEVVSEAANLPADFSVSYVMKDSNTSPSNAVKRANEMMNEGVHAIVGPLLSASAGPVSLMAGIDKIPVMAYASTAPSLSDKSTYPYFGRTILSDSKLTAVIIDTCKRLGWSSMSVLYQDDTWGSGLAEAINTAAAELDVKILTAQKFRYTDPESIKDAVDAAATYGGRIYLFAVMETALEDLFFAAEQAGIAGRGYTWVNTGGIEDPGAAVASSSDPPRLQHLISGVLDVRDRALYGDLEDRLGDSLSKMDPERLYDPVMGEHDEVIDSLLTAPHNLCGYIYDATWAQGLAISRAGLTEDGQLDRESQLHHLRNLDFTGATGRVKMNPETGDRMSEGITMIVQNWQPTVTEDGAPSVESVLIALHQGGEEGLVKVRDPYWAGGMTEWEQVPGDGFQCRAGYVLDEESMLCAPCPPGSEQRGAACAPCDVGRHADQAGTIACPKCGEGYANETGLVECHVCPLNSYRPAGTLGVSIEECVCEPGTFTRHGPGTACEACPAGAWCEGYDTAPYPLPGFWGDKTCKALGGTLECEAGFEFFECKGKDCAGGPDFECEEGRTGRMCKDTLDDWYNVGRIVYLECSDGGTWLAFLAILATVVAWVVLLVACDKYASIDVLLKFMSINAMVATFGFKWHSKLNGLNVLLKIANFDIDFVSPGCFGSWKPIHSFFTQLLLPFIVTALYVVVLATYRLIRRPEHGHALLLVAFKMLVSLSLTVYHTSVYKSFATFSCASLPDGKLYLTHEPTVECWGGSHIAMLVMGVLYIALGGLGLPVFLWHTVRKHRREATLQDQQIHYLYGWLHDRYKMQYKNWFLMVCVRRFAISLIAAVVPWSMLQGMVTVVVIVALLGAQVTCHPHNSHRIDLLEILSLCETVLYVLGGMLMYTSITSKAQGHVCTGDAEADAVFCADDNAIKDGVAVFAVLCMALTLAIAGALSFTLAWEQHSSTKAARLLAACHSKPRAENASGSAGRGQAEEAEGSALGHILHSAPVLRWASHAKARLDGPGDGGDEEKGGPESEQLGEEEFRAVERGLAELAKHFASAKSVRAAILHKVAAIPGLLEWVAVERSGRESLRGFVHGFAAFLRKEKLLHQHSHPAAASSASGPDMQQAACDASLVRDASGADLSESVLPLQPLAPRGRRDSLVLSMMGMASGAGTKKTMFPITAMVKPEHVATAAYYLLTCAPEERAHLCSLLDAISRASAPAAHSLRAFHRSSSESTGPDLLGRGPAALLRQTSSSGRRRLSLDDYPAPSFSSCSEVSPAASPGFKPRTAAPARQKPRAGDLDADGAGPGPSAPLAVYTPRTLPPSDAGQQGLSMSGGPAAPRLLLPAPSPPDADAELALGAPVRAAEVLDPAGSLRLSARGIPVSVTEVLPTTGEEAQWQIEAAMHTARAYGEASASEGQESAPWGAQPAV